MGMKIKERLVQAAEVAEALKKIFMGIGVMFFSVIVVLIFVGEMAGPRLAIKTFDVPEALTEKGFDGRVLSNHIMDQYYGIYQEANTLKENMGMRPKWEKQDVHIGVGDTGFSPEGIRHLIGYLNARTTVISGDVVKKEPDGRLQMTLRINEKSFTLEGETPEVIVDKGAQAIIGQTEPYILAHYHWYKAKKSKDMEAQKKEEKECSRILDRILRDYSRGQASLDQHAWAYILRGNMFMAKGREGIETALDYYTKAAGLNTRFALAHRNRATALRMLGRSDESLEVCQDWLAFDGNNWEPYFNLALAHFTKFLKNSDQSKNNLNMDLASARQAFERALYFKKTKDIDYVEILCAYVTVLDTFGGRFEREKKFKAAVDTYKAAITLDRSSENEVLKRTPLQNGDACYYTDYLKVLNHLGRLLSTCEAPGIRNREEAEKLFERAERIGKMGCFPARKSPGLN